MRMRPRDMALFLSTKNMAKDGLEQTIRDGMASRRITPETTDLAVMLDIELNRDGTIFVIEGDEDAVKVTLGKKTARLTVQKLINDDVHDLFKMGAYCAKSE